MAIQTSFIGKNKKTALWDDRKHAGMITLKILGGIAWELHPSKMLEVVADHDVWQLNLELLPLHPLWT